MNSLVEFNHNLPVDKEKEEFDKTSVLERFDHQLKDLVKYFKHFKARL